MAIILPSTRVRRTPFSDGVEAAGVTGYSVYNHMLLPVMFETGESDYRHLKTHVQVWDVSCERQVALEGPDAGRLLRMLTPRDLSGMQVGQCRYVPMVDDAGGMLNDPVAVKLADDRFWVSIADSDLLLWIRGVAAALKLDVRVEEPDVSPLAVQGPRSDDLMARVFGDEVRAVRFFRFGRFAFEGHDFVIARSGYSKQGGFEIYVDGTERGMPLWHALFAAGEDLHVRAGCPNWAERIEGGLLSYGGDMTRANTPHECGLGKFCNLQAVTDCMGRDALLREEEAGPARQIRPIEIAGRAPPSNRKWPIMIGDRQVGDVTSAAWSPDFDCTVAIGMVDRAHWAPGTAVRIETQEGALDGRVRERFWI